ncbi:putative LRR receptor-like serine/threonine-protein kinase [Vitis vinifera]|uniref:non-specific serine/threonine protein kinase n=1 Tax=Vitis vinifera TaxID=29760 RepID=A0A438CMJ2_VITVI|nr:putative LRR receptor-like serine/threonine-protein kinase [Vitis vinifera]
MAFPSLWNLRMKNKTEASTNRVGAVDDTLALLSFKSVVSDSQNVLSGSALGLVSLVPTTELEFCHFVLLVMGSLNINLARNSINDTIRVGLSHCYNLEEIYFEHNQLIGNLPSELGDLPRLRILDVAANNLTARNQFFAEIPNELGHLHNLQRLQLSENQFEGKIPYSIYNISSLIYLSVTENMLVGELPTDMGLVLPNLAEVYLAHNQLEGPIPSSFSNASQIQVLDFSSNHFQGPVPLLGNMNNLRLLHLGLNNLSSTTKLNLQVFNSLANCTQLEFLYLNDNQLAGELPTSVANLSTHLLEFCFGSNFLTGSIPRGFERFQNLWALDIHQNLFTESPQVLECQNLKRLGLRQNKLNGSIPKEIFRLHDIIEIYLAHNELSGSQPALVESLEHLEVLDVSNNQLSGNISTTIGSCLSLRSFNIATNKLSGAIPVSMGKLIALESLDLSSNSLTGQIPEELQDLLYFQILNLSFNDLEGPVPRKGVFMNLTWLSLTGNNKLCGSDPEAAGKLRIPTCITKVKSNRHLILKIVIPVASFTLLMCAACITWMLITQYKKKRRGTTFPSPCFKALPPKISYSDIQHATNDFSAENWVGKGGFGSVYKGVFRTGENGVNTIFAVKVIDLQQECGLGRRISTSRDVYSYGILLLEIFTAKKPTDEMFQEGLDQHKLASALLINQFLDMADKRLFNNDACTDYSIFTSSSGDFNSIGTSSNTLSHWKIKTEECITAIIHVGLSCAAHSTTDRSTMREALTK